MPTSKVNFILGNLLVHHLLRTTNDGIEEMKLCNGYNSSL